jgi:hypothetical protein
LTWKSPLHSFTKSYREFGLHALSSDPANYGKPCLYCQKLSENQVEQWLFIPDDAESRKAYSVEAMFEAFTECSVLNVNPDCEVDMECFRGPQYEMEVLDHEFPDTSFADDLALESRRRERAEESQEPVKKKPKRRE